MLDGNKVLVHLNSVKNDDKNGDKNMVTLLVHLL